MKNNNPLIRKSYITCDGKEFSDWTEAEDHAIFLLRSKTPEDYIRNNLANLLSNKSKLKAGILRRNEKEYTKAWNNWLKALPKSKAQLLVLNFAEFEKFTKHLSDSLYKLERALCKYRRNIRTLKEAKSYIPRLNSALKNPEIPPTEDLIMLNPSEIAGW